MKNVIIALLCLTSLGAYSFQKVRVPITNVYVPSGFDTNDSTEIFLTGYLPDLCHQGPHFQTKTVGSTIYIQVLSNTVTAEDFCPQVIVPFSTVVPLGQMEALNYNIVVNGGSQFQINSSITIKHAKSQKIDDYLYALVKDIKVEGDTLFLKGVNPSDCFELRDIRIISNQKDTYSVLPRLNIVGKCNRAPKPFIYKTKFINKLGVDKALFHVRLMDGRSINKIIDLANN